MLQCIRYRTVVVQVVNSSYSRHRLTPSKSTHNKRANRKQPCLYFIPLAWRSSPAPRCLRTRIGASATAVDTESVRLPCQTSNPESLPSAICLTLITTLIQSFHTNNLSHFLVYPRKSFALLSRNEQYISISIALEIGGDRNGEKLLFAGCTARLVDAMSVLAV